MLSIHTSISCRNAVLGDGLRDGALNGPAVKSEDERGLLDERMDSDTAREDMDEVREMRDCAGFIATGNAGICARDVLTPVAMLSLTTNGKRATRRKWAGLPGLRKEGRALRRQESSSGSKPYTLLSPVVKD
ncbi:unnamed protein product [Mycena citricolor]|uniref:Uncharacterized protein n=1 Tax=Mycena citricolor TaxID=2018698 RepID=A0AAD2GWK6_9AGAR|nr:unnamed protein product [Mycena citricolor]